MAKIDMGFDISGGSVEPTTLLGASKYATGNIELCEISVALKIDNTDGYFTKTITNDHISKLVATKPMKIKIISSINRSTTNITRKIYKNDVEIINQSLTTYGGDVKEVNIDMNVGDYLRGNASVSDVNGGNGYTLLILLIN